MRITINLKDSIIYDKVNQFVEYWLYPAVKQSLLTKVKIYRNILTTEYQSKNSDLNIYEDLINACNSLVIRHNKDYGQILIEIDSVKFNTKNTAKLYDICAMINFGSVSSRKYPIFTETFNYYQKNFWFFYRYYYLGILPCP